MTSTYVKRADAYTKQQMQECIDDENEFQKMEPSGMDEYGNEVPIEYKLERHSGCYQMTAYVDGKIYDNSYHESFVRCDECGALNRINGGDCNCCIKCWNNLD